MVLVSRDLINRFRKALETYSERELARLKRADVAALKRLEQKKSAPKSAL